MTDPAAWQHAFHLTVPDHWLNDPQRPIYAQGAYQYFYLYNGDYPEPTGTSWRRVSTTDGMRFRDHGVPMDKWSQPNRDLWSGCLVVDEEGTAGLGDGAVVALVTQLDRVGEESGRGGGQAQFLWYSTDGGETFSNLSDTPVLANRGWEHFRDPKIERIDGRWIMVLAEDTDLGFYASDDLRSWTEVSRFREERIGMLECPDLFRMTADDGTSHWVLAASPQRSDPSRSDRPGTYAYWVGDFDGTQFHPDEAEPQWLDHGFDWYAAVSWAVHDADGAPTSDRRWAIGWMNNWAYAMSVTQTGEEGERPDVGRVTRELAGLGEQERAEVGAQLLRELEASFVMDHPPTWTDSGYNGIDSVVRELTLVRSDGGYELRSRPLRELASAPVPLEATEAVQEAPAAASVVVRVTPTTEGAGVRVKCSADGTRGVDVVVTPTEIRVDRGASGCPGDGSLALARAPWRGGPVELEILIDRATVEVFADGGRVALSMLSFAPAEDTGVQLIGSAGAVTDAAVARVAATALEEG